MRTCDDDKGTATCRFGGQAWRRVDYASIEHARDDIGYLCVSYAWGPARVAHPFDAGQDVSARALLAVPTAARACLQPQEGLWVDSLCLPSDGPAREASLLRMGEIYGGARMVVVVLSAECAPLLAWFADRGASPLSLNSLEPLAHDTWITRAWTYQEVANSARLCFVAEGHPEVRVEGQPFLERLGHAIAEEFPARGVSTEFIRARYPLLDRYTELLLDWMITDFPERNAYRVLIGMSGRAAERPDDVYAAMLGAIDSPGEGTNSDDDPAERFMRHCESRGDYSFIATTGPRASSPHWRPQPGPLPVVLPWHVYGKGLNGTTSSEGLALRELVLLPRGALLPATLEAIAPWLSKRTDLDADGMALTTRCRLRLEAMGYAGRSAPVTLEAGVFFGHGDEEVAEDDLIAACIGLRWTAGALGLRLRRVDDGTYRLRDVGVIVGHVPLRGGTMTLES